jgi:ABC-2 type transport system ATP-binding protein
VSGVDLTVHQGEIFALLGPNGAGKTTIVEILEGHRRRDSGSVRVLGQDPANAGRAWRARIGIVPQQATDATGLTVIETLRFFARCYPAPRDPESVLAQVGLTDQARLRVRALSGGQRRRLDVGISVVGAPELVFLDEPTTGFDPEARRAFWAMIRDLAAEGTTILLTTHYLDEAETLADRLAVVVDGRIAAEGTPATLGGRASAQATVSWTDGGGRHAVRTGDPGALVARLSADAAPADLTVTRPSLEDTYLHLIGERR